MINYEYIFIIGYALIQLPEFLLFFCKKFKKIVGLLDAKMSSADTLSRTNSSSNHVVEDKVEKLEG